MLNSVFSFALNATTTVADITTAAPKTEFNPSGFLEQLPKMGIGMLSIFIVIGLIIGATCLVNIIFKPRNKTPKN